VFPGATGYTDSMTTPERDGVALTHLDEPLFDGAGATKRDLVDYLDAVAEFILPELTVDTDGDPVGRVVQARGPLRALQ